MGICECFGCGRRGAKSRNKLTGTTYCYRCARRLSSLFIGIMDIHVDYDRVGLLGATVNACLDDYTLFELQTPEIQEEVTCSEEFA